MHYARTSRIVGSCVAVSGAWLSIPYAARGQENRAVVTPAPASRPATATSIPTTSPALIPPVNSARAHLTLEQLEPSLATTTSAPTSAPAENRPLSERGAQYLRRGEELVAQERYTEAGRELEKALRSDPTRHEIHRALALAMFRAGNRDRAAAHARQALQFQSDDLLAHYLLGRMAFDAGRFADAVLAFRRGIASSNVDGAPDFAVLTWSYLARSLESEEFLTAALAAYREYERRAAALPPSAAAANQELASLLRSDGGSAAEAVGRILQRLERPAEAADTLGRVIAQGDADPAARARYARVLAEARRYDEALEQARLITGADQLDGRIQLLVDIRTMMGDPTLALTDVLGMVQEQPDDPAILRAYVDLLRRFDRGSEAEKAMTDYVAAHPQASEMAWTLCDDLIDAGRAADALALACRTLAADPESHPQAVNRIDRISKDPAAEAILAKEWPDDATHHGMLGVLALRLGQIEQGVSRLRAALDAAPELTYARFALADQWLKEFRWQEVIELVSGHAEKDANLEWALGEAYAGLDENDQAADHYSAAVRLNRADTRSMFALARLYERTERGLRARRQYEAILQIEPLHQTAREALIDLLVNERQMQEAQVHLDELRKMAASPNRIARCEARLELAVSSGGLERYRQVLTDAMAASGPDADSLALVAVSFIGQSDPASAEAPLRQALQLDPDNAQARELLVPVFAQQLRFAEAIEELRKLLRRHPHRPAWIKSLAEILRIEQDYESAAKVLTEFIARGKLTGSDLQEFRGDLLNVLEAADKHAERIALLKEWLKEDEANRALRAALANAYLDAEDKVTALALSRGWHEASPAEAEPAALYRQVLLRAKRYTAAEQMFLEALELDPADENLLLGLARTLSEAERYDDALEVISSRLTDPPGPGRNLNFLLNKLVILQDARRFEDAAALLGDMIQDETLTGEGGPLTIDDLQLQLARVLFNAERYNDAQTRLSRWIERTESEPARFQYLRTLAGVYQQRNLADRAIEALDMAYAISPNSPEINNDLGYTLAEAGRRMADAERMVRLAAAREPVNGAYLDSLGWVLYRRGDFKGARHWLAKATGTPGEGEDPVIFDHLGDACWQMMAREEAVERWKKAVTLAEERLKEREDPTYRRVLDSAKKKLEAVAADQTPAVAEVVKEEPEPRREPGAPELESGTPHDERPPPRPADEGPSSAPATPSAALNSAFRILHSSLEERRYSARRHAV